MRADSAFTLAALLGCVLAAAAPQELGAATPAADGRELLRALHNDDAGLAGKLIAGHAAVNIRDEMGATPLMWTAQRVDARLTEQLLRAGADPNICGGEGLCPLHIAIENGAREVALLLLAHGARVNLPRENGETALMTAARTGQIEVMLRLIALGANVNAYEKRFHQTALMWSAGYPEQVKLLIAHGANVHAHTQIWTVTDNLYRDLSAGAEWDIDGEYVIKKGGQSALFFAVRKDDIPSVQALLDAGIDVNETSADGSTALLLSLNKWDSAKWVNNDELSPRFTPDVALANLLLDRGARVNVVDSIGYTPLHGAVLCLVLEAPTLRYAPGVKLPTPDAPADPQQALSLVRRLLDMNANVHAVTQYSIGTANSYFRLNPATAGYSPLHIAALTSNVELVQLLLERGADPNQVARNGHTPLSLAIKANDLPLVAALVSRGADVSKLLNPVDNIPVARANTKNAEPTGPRRNQTSLHVAAVARADKVIAFLVDQGVSLEARNDHGETPLDLAESQEKVEALREADPNTIAKADSKPEHSPTATSDLIKGLMRNATKVSAQR